MYPPVPCTRTLKGALYRAGRLVILTVLGGPLANLGVAEHTVMPMTVVRRLATFPSLIQYKIGQN